VSAGRDFIRELANIPRDVVNAHAEGRFVEGFNEAAAISFDAIAIKIDSLKEQVRQGGELSTSEQAMLVGLSDLRSDLEIRLRDYLFDDAAD